jgi:hypothetical protein
MPAISLDAADAIELAGLLQFIGDWLKSDRESLTASLARFVGSAAYGPAALRDDFARFRFLLGATDGEGVVSAQDDLLNGSAARREFGVARQAIIEPLGAITELLVKASRDARPNAVAGFRNSTVATVPGAADWIPRNEHQRVHRQAGRGENPAGGQPARRRVGRRRGE